MKARSVLIAALLLLALTSAPVFSQEDSDVDVEDDDYADVTEERAFIIARKFFLDEDIVVKRKSTVVVELYNAGSSAASKVEVKESPLPPDIFKLVKGDLSASFDRLSAGATVKFEYDVVPQVQGGWNIPPATVSYNPEAASKDVQITLSTGPTVMVISPFQQQLRKLLVLGTYATLGMVRSGAEWRQWGGIIAIVTGALLANWFYKKTSQARKTHKYNKALQEVEKMK